MPKRRANRTTKPADQKDADLIITMDPASVSNSGLCVRPVNNVLTPNAGYARKPEWWTSDSVWNTQMHDELARVIAKWVPRGGRVAFATTSTSYQGTALSIGRAIGCIEGLLHDLNVFVDTRVEPVQDQTWRRGVFQPQEWKVIADMQGHSPDNTSKLRRAAWKQLAIDTVARRYMEAVDDNAAEAILLNDYVVLWRPDLWKAGAERRELDLDLWKRGQYGALRS